MSTNFAKTLFGKINMTSNCDVTNNAHQIQMTTTCHWMKPPHESFLRTQLVVRDAGGRRHQLETNLLQLFAHPEYWELLSIISVIAFGVNIVAEQKKHNWKRFFLYKFPLSSTLLLPPCPTIAPAPLAVAISTKLNSCAQESNEGYSKLSINQIEIVTGICQSHYQSHCMRKLCEQASLKIQIVLLPKTIFFCGPPFFLRRRPQVLFIVFVVPSHICGWLQRCPWPSITFKVLALE